MKGRSSGARWTIAVALTIIATGCASRVSHEELLADARNQGAGSPRGAEAPSGATGDGVGVPGSEAGEAGPGLSGDPGVAPGGGTAVGSDVGGVATRGSSTTITSRRTTGGAGGGTKAASDGSGVSGGAGGQPAPGTGGGSGSADKGDRSPTAPGPARPSVPAACSGAKPTIPIGAVGAQSGPAGVAVADTARAVAAWVASVNAKGGLRCHPLRYIIADDGSDPARNQALSRKLVEEDRVVALVANNSPLAGYASVKYVTEKRIPAIGSEGGGDWYYQSPMYFPQMATGYGMIGSQFAGTTDIGRSLGLTKVATLACVEAPTCDNYVSRGEKLASGFGTKLVYKGKGTLVQPDYTSHCQAAQQAGAEMLIVGLETNSMARVAKSCASVNYRPLISTPLSGAHPKMVSNPELEGLVVGMPVLPWMLSDHSAIQEYQRVFKQYAPGLPLSAATIAGWVAAKLFKASTQNLTEITSETILEGLWSLKNNDLGGLTYPLTFTKGQNAPQVLCYWQTQLKNGQFVSPNNGVRQCVEGWPF